MLPYNTEKLINFYEDIKFYLPYDYKDKIVQNYLTNIKSIKGTQKLKINGTEVYDFTYVNWFWIGSALLSVILTALVWNAKRSED